MSAGSRMPGSILTDNKFISTHSSAAAGQSAKDSRICKMRGIKQEIGDLMSQIEQSKW